MRTVVIGGSTILLLLIGAAFVGFRRSPDAGATSASILKAGASILDGGASTPEAEPDPPGGLVFEKTDIDLGAVPAGKSRRITVAWRRTGVGPLRIRRIETGCGCLVATGLPDVIPAGARGEVVLEAAGRSSPGPFHLVVKVLTDRPPDDLHYLRVRGFVGALAVVSPLALPLAAVSPHSLIERIVAVRFAPGAAPVRVDVLLVGLEGEAHAVEPLFALDRGAAGKDVLVKIRAPTAPGAFEGRVEIRAGEQGLWQIPVRGTVVAPRPEEPER